MPEIRKHVAPRRGENYLLGGMTDVARQKRRENYIDTPKTATDYRFHTLFHQDYYSSAIIGKKGHIEAESKWIDRDYMARYNDPIFNEILEVVANTRIKRIMSFKCSWNKEIIAQFYATLYVEEGVSVRRMHWMTEGRPYSISFTSFSRRFGLGEEDASFPKLHRADGPMPAKNMKFMYPRTEQGNFGKVKGLYTYYLILNNLFRVTLTPRGGNQTEVSNYARDLLAAMRPPGVNFSIGEYLWEEIRIISESPQRLCGFAPYVMYLIEKTTKRQFLKDTKHEALRPNLPKKIRVPSPNRYGEGEADLQQQQEQPAGQPEIGFTSSGNRFHRFEADQQQSTSYRPSEKPSSPIRRILSFLTGICKSQRDIMVEQQRQRVANKRINDSIKFMHNSMNLQPPRSPPSPAPVEEEIPSVEDLVANYQSQAYFEPLQHHFGYGAYQPPPPPPAPGMTGMDFPGASSSAAPPPPPTHGEDFASRATAALFGPPTGPPTGPSSYGPSFWQEDSPSHNGDGQ